MMLRAEAPVFTPQELPAEVAEPAQKADKDDSTFAEESCSTVAPSPALTTQCASPTLSPFWGFEEAGFSPDAMWATALYGGYMADEYGNYLPEFTLPELQLDGSGYPDFSAYGRCRANTEPAYMVEHAEFSLEGGEELAGLLQQIVPSDPGCQQEDESQGSTSAGPVSPPPGLAPPPGLEAPPGLELDEFEAPPGLEARAKTRNRANTWPVEKDSKPSPLPPGTTTAMLRNIPNKYTQAGLVERLHEAGYRGELDFIYLPIDFKNKCNVGYAFVNFRTAKACARFGSEYHHCNSRDKLPGYNSKKVCEVSAARFQGCEENIRRLQASNVMSELVANPDWLPKLFDENGEEVDFPITDMSKEVLPQSRSARGRLQKRK